jgi:hypothetical protein
MACYATIDGKTIKIFVSYEVLPSLVPHLMQYAGSLSGM